MSVLVTGATGLIGMALVRMLVENNEEDVVAFHRNPAKRNLDDLKDKITIFRVIWVSSAMYWKRSRNTDQESSTTWAPC